MLEAVLGFKDLAHSSSGPLVPVLFFLFVFFLITLKVI